jgi:hypothetical protein
MASNLKENYGFRGKSSIVGLDASGERDHFHHQFYFSRPDVLGQNNSLGFAE